MLLSLLRIDAFTLYVAVVSRRRESPSCVTRVAPNQATKVTAASGNQRRQMSRATLTRVNCLLLLDGRAWRGPEPLRRTSSTRGGRGTRIPVSPPRPSQPGGIGKKVRHSASASGEAEPAGSEYLGGRRLGECFDKGRDLMEMKIDRVPSRRRQKASLTSGNWLLFFSVAVFRLPLTWPIPAHHKRILNLTPGLRGRSPASSARPA
jgi:hypothetical protein